MQLLIRLLIPWLNTWSLTSVLYYKTFFISRIDSLLKLLEVLVQWMLVMWVVDGKRFLKTTARGFHFPYYVFLPTVFTSQTSNVVLYSIGLQSTFLFILKRAINRSKRGVSFENRYVLLLSLLADIYYELSMWRSSCDWVTEQTISSFTANISGQVVLAELSVPDAKYFHCPF